MYFIFLAHTTSLQQKLPVFSESTTKDLGGNDEQGWGGISEVQLFHIEPRRQVAEAAQIKRRKKGVSIHAQKQKGGEKQPNQN